MTHDAALLADIERFVAGTGIKETYFGRLAVNDGKLVRRLRSGRPIETKTADKIRAFMRSEREKREKVLRVISEIPSHEAAA